MKLVLTARNRGQVALDFLLTGLAWGVFIVLIASAERAEPYGMLSYLATMLHYLLVVACLVAILYAWALYNAARFHGIERRTMSGTASLQQLAGFFRITENLLAQTQNSQRIVVHHDPNGQIHSIDNTAWRMRA